MRRKRYERSDRVSLPELLTQIRRLPQGSRNPQREPSEDLLRERIESLGIGTEGTTRGGVRRTTLSRVDAERIVESLRAEQAATFFDEELQGFILEPDEGSSDEPIGAALPTAYFFAPPGTRIDGREPTHALRVSPQELLEFFHAKNGGRTEALEDLRRRFLERLPRRPQVFRLVLSVQARDVDAYLQAVIASIPTPIVRGADREDLQLQAFTHLRMKVWPMIATLDRNPRAYLKIAVRNFYADAVSVGRELVSLEETSTRSMLYFGIEPEPPKG